MNRPLKILVSLTTVALVSACSNDSQTESDVVTSTADGSVETSMSGDAADERGVALVRIVNAVPDMQRLTVRGDNMRELPTVEYKAVSPYETINEDWTRFEVSGASGGAYAPIESNRESLTDGHRYTMFILREEDGGELTTRIVRDDISSDMSKAHVRVIHAARGTENFDLIAGGDNELFSDVSYGVDGGFKDIDPWQGTLEFRADDGNRRMLSLPNIDLRAGSSYTIVVARSAANALEAFWFSDTPTPERNPATMPR